MRKRKTASTPIRTATEADAESIARLTQDLGYPAEIATTRRRLQRILGRSDHLLIVAESGGEVCGWLQAHACDVLESGFRVEIVGLIVAAPMRRKGIGKVLVAKAESWAAGLSADAVVVRSNVNRAESHEFYSALGYKTVKTQTVYRKERRGGGCVRSTSRSSHLRA